MEEFEEQTKSLKKNSELTEKKVIVNNFLNVQFYMYSFSTVNPNEYIERIHQVSFSSLFDNGMLQIFSFLIK